MNFKSFQVTISFFITLAIFCTTSCPAEELTKNQKIAVQAQAERLKEIISKVPSAKNLNNLKNYFRQVKEAEKQLSRAKVAQDNPEAAEVYGLLAKTQELLEKQEEQVKAATPSLGSKGGKVRPIRVKGDSPLEIIKQALELAEQGKAQKKPAFFGPHGGVTRAMDMAKETLEKMKTSGASPEEIALAQVEFDKAQKQISEISSGLKDQILAEIEMPPEKYQGADKEEFRTKITEEWKKLFPKDEILAIRFHSDWHRDAKLKWNSGDKSFDAKDKSVLPVKVIVKTSDTIATIFMAFVNKDNLSGSINLGCNTKEGEYVVEEMLMKNFKP